MIHRILTLSYYGSNENDDVLAMKTCQEGVFVERRGSRPAAINTIIYITDGPYGIPTKAQLMQASSMDSSDIRIITIAIYLDEKTNLKTEENLAKLPVTTFAPGSYYNFFYGIDSYVDPNYRGLLIYSVLSSDKIYLSNFDELDEIRAFYLVEKLQEIRASVPSVTPINEKPPITFNLYDFLNNNQTTTAKPAKFIKISKEKKGSSSKVSETSKFETHNNNRTVKTSKSSKTKTKVTETKMTKSKSSKNSDTPSEFKIKETYQIHEKKEGGGKKKTSSKVQSTITKSPKTKPSTMRNLIEVYGDYSEGFEG